MSHSIERERDIERDLPSAEIAGGGEGSMIV